MVVVIVVVVVFAVCCDSWDYVVSLEGVYDKKKYPPFNFESLNRVFRCKFFASFISLTARLLASFSSSDRFFILSLASVYFGWSKAAVYKGE